MTFTWVPKQRTYEHAKSTCHVRSAIMRWSKPEVKYWKNHDVPFDERVPAEDQSADDWVEYDPREHEECPEFEEMPA